VNPSTPSSSSRPNPRSRHPPPASQRLPSPRAPPTMAGLLERRTTSAAAGAAHRDLPCAHRSSSRALHAAMAPTPRRAMAGRLRLRGSSHDCRAVGAGHRRSSARSRRPLARRYHAPVWWRGRRLRHFSKNVGKNVVPKLMQHFTKMLTKNE
jgi:hypothetical protein